MSILFEQRKSANKTILLCFHFPQTKLPVGEKCRTHQLTIDKLLSLNDWYGIHKKLDDYIEHKWDWREPVEYSVDQSSIAIECSWLDVKNKLVFDLFDRNHAFQRSDSCIDISVKYVNKLEEYFHNNEKRITNGKPESIKPIINRFNPLDKHEEYDPTSNTKNPLNSIDVCYTPQSKLNTRKEEYTPTKMHDGSTDDEQMYVPRTINSNAKRKHSSKLDDPKIMDRISKRKKRRSSSVDCGAVNLNQPSKDQLKLKESKSRVGTATIDPERLFAKYMGNEDLEKKSKDKPDDSDKKNNIKCLNEKKKENFPKCNLVNDCIGKGGATTRSKKSNLFGDSDDGGMDTKKTQKKQHKDAHATKSTSEDADKLLNSNIQIVPKRPVSPFLIKTLKGVPISNILKSYDNFKSKLEAIYNNHCNGEVKVKLSKEYDRMFPNDILDEKTVLELLDFLKEKLNDKCWIKPLVEQDAILPEWILLFFMQHYDMNRSDAIVHINRQFAHIDEDGRKDFEIFSRQRRYKLK